MKRITECIVCKSKKFTFQYFSQDRMFDLPGKFSLKKCNKCSLAFLDPQPVGSELKKYYPSQQYYAYNKSNARGFFGILREYLIKHYYSPNFLSLFMTTFVKNVPAMPSYCQGGKILDLGCGTGDTLVLLKRLGWDTYGIDIDKRAISAGINRGLTNLKLGTYRDLDKYPDNFFDAVRLYHVIEHLDNPSLCLKLIRKKLKKNGELIIGTPNIESIASFIFGKHWYNLDTPRHIFLFSPKTLKDLLIQEELHPTSVEYISAGGILGSLQYIIEDIFKKKINLIHKQWLVIMLYPVERALDMFRLGDIFNMRAKIL